MQKLVHLMLSTRSSKLSSFLKICFYSALIWWFLLFCLSDNLCILLHHWFCLVPSSVIFSSVIAFFWSNWSEERVARARSRFEPRLLSCSMAVIPLPKAELVPKVLEQKPWSLYLSWFHSNCVKSTGNGSFHPNGEQHQCQKGRSQCQVWVRVHAGAITENWSES